MRALRCAALFAALLVGSNQAFAQRVRVTLGETQTTGTLQSLTHTGSTAVQARTLGAFRDVLSAREVR